MCDRKGCMEQAEGVIDMIVEGEQQKQWHFCIQHYNEAVSMASALHLLTGVPKITEKRGEDGNINL